MATGITFGRAGLATASGGDGLSLYRAEWEQEGDEAKVELIIRKPPATTAAAWPADAKALRDQLLGYHLNSDEVVVPVVDSADSTRTGFYRVNSVRQKAELTGREGAVSEGLAYSFTADLLRVPGWQSPLFEVSTSGALRSNVHAILAASATSYVAIPALETTANISDITSVTTPVTEYGANADLMVIGDAGVTDLPGKSVTYSVAVGDFHGGSCGVFAGSRVASSSAPVVTSHRTVVGRQPLNAPTAWMISNDLIRVLPGPSAGEILVGQWEDSAGVGAGSNVWSYKSYRISYAALPEFCGDAKTMTVLRNSPERVTIRCWFQTVVATLKDLYVDFTLTRGAPWVEGYIAVVGATSQLGVFRFTDEAATAVTGGIDATADDAALNKYRIRTPVAKTNNLVKGGMYNTAAAGSFPFAIGTDFFAGVDVTDGYWAAMNHRQRIVVR